MKPVALTLMVASSLALAGCPLKELMTYQPPEHVLQPSTEQTMETDTSLTPLERVVDYYNQTESLSAQERNQRYRVLMNKLEENDRPMLRLQLVMLLLEGSDKDRLQARQYLAELHNRLKREQEQELAGFVLLVNRLLVRISNSQDATTVAQQQLTEKEEHIQTLLKKINALKSIEKSIYEREYGIGERDTP